MSTVLLGIDVGTSVIKAALFDRAGTELATASLRTEVIEPRPGWFELDPEATWRAVATTCRAVLENARLDKGEIAAVGVTGAMVGAWLVDGDGRSIRPGILWNDNRAQPLVMSLVEKRPDLFSRVFSCSGSVMQFGCTLPVLLWLSVHEPGHLARARAVLTPKDFIRLRLTDRIGAEETEAAVAPGSARGRRFEPALLPLFGLEGTAGLFPPVGASAALAGTVTEAAAALTGLRAGTPVAFGAGDTPACVIGAGAGAPGLAATVLGTTCLNGVVFDEPTFTPTDLGLLFTIPGELWMKTMVNIAGTTNLDWCLSALCPDLGSGADAYAALAALAETSPPGAAGLIYVPYLSAGGVIAPRIEPGARGGFVGLEPRHTRADLVRAVYEGVALSIRDCFAAIDRPVTAIRLSGGGAKSAFWSQMIADVVGRPVEVPEGYEFGAKGAALLAGTALGWYGTVEEACLHTFRLKRRHTPEFAREPAYDRAFARYKAASAAMLDSVAPVYR